VVYETRNPGDEKVNFSKRIAYLIDPDGVIRRAYEVTDVNTFASDVLSDLRALS
jgi:peroxiredoxin